MTCKKMSLCMSVFLAFLLLTVFQAAAAVKLTVTPVGSSLFVLQGKDLDGIAALDLQFSYDPAVMANPKGSRGGLIPGDAIFNFNPSVPGEVRLFIRIVARAVTGTGTIATIGFDRVGDAAGSIKSLSANLVTVQATPVMASVQILNQPAPVESAETVTVTAIGSGTGAAADMTAGSSGGVTEGTTGAPPVAISGVTPSVAPGATPGTIVLGSVSMPGDRIEKVHERQDKIERVAIAPEDAEQQSSNEAGSDPDSGQPPVPPSSSITAAQPKHTTYQSVLDRMKEYTGKRSPAALMALFNPAPGQKVRQEPPVGISDGENTVNVFIELPLTQNDTPSFSLRQADMVSLGQADDGSWLIGLKLKKNTLEASITISFEGGSIMFPLAVSPPIDPALLALKGSPEATFADFLKQSGEGRDSRYDLNGDGRHDYRDDYIFTAHYLIARQKPVLKMPGEVTRD